MRSATIVSRSEISGEHTHTVEHEDMTLFLATVAGTVEGITAAGSVVVSLVIDKEN